MIFNFQFPFKIKIKNVIHIIIFRVNPIPKGIAIRRNIKVFWVKGDTVWKLNNLHTVKNEVTTLDILYKMCLNIYYMQYL